MNLPKRKPTRLNKYDYSTPGAYFITICTKDKQHLLSHITVGAIHESPVNILTPYGKIIEDILIQLPQRFQIKIDAYVIMPNHIHILFCIPDDHPLRAIRESPLQTRRSLSSKMVGYLKMNASKQIHQTTPGISVWQRSFHDHIIRGEKDYQKIWEYIDTNVIRWELDCFHPNNKKTSQS